ncbi:DNA-directed RNA polymerase III subunit RPC5 [Trichoplusia ni]|uniref:DNA-directed RNA polymerase III subunit RPC5 n=1 Tax=Trichoplusia ni TaxID=7111 RepID=A0A7E5VL33_TRINI|nr:DNA-directed RNA polymerase III subunit RPC5 [Trichoplusia ni]
MEEEDPVVQEIPVFLSQSLAKHLYVYQYPVRPANRDWKDVKVVNAAIKPRNKMVRLEVGLDTYSDRYCTSKGEQIAINTDGQQESSWHIKERDKSQYFKHGVMDKIVYESSTPCTETEHYAVAILQDKELHCTPIQGVIQMRPSYSYYDKQDKHQKDKNNSDSDEEEKEAEAQQVTVKFARQETEVSKKAREKSFETMSQKVNEESWYDALWKSSETDHAELERMKLFSATASSGSALLVGAREYVRALVPAAPKDEAGAAPTQPEQLHDQIKEILINAKLMTFSELRSRVASGAGAAGAARLLTALGGAGVCVRGLWAARSPDYFTTRRALPVPQRLLCAARDHVLYLFTQHPYIDRRKVAAAVRLPPELVLDIIRSVAKFNPNTGWELILPPDVAFEAKYPDVIQRQNLNWEARQRLFNEMMIGENIPKRQRKKSQRDSVSSDTMMSPKPRNNSVSEEDSDRKRHKNKSASGSGKRTRNISSSSAQDAT